ncbi:TPA: hypothetical protein KOC08_001798 [Clostridioides difficile]|uniref:hypothetical protein n=1 Tax=Clostridioides difficile TaxID=1496 RepID=UPI001C1D5822|nr:hypothetical protein [Clostridioides difficile]MCI9926377.1 hypothetical protein [Clostridioides difficile]MCI9930066.1 hypothetical protein [Clostridioides difficile]MDN9384488.1 hypothetical protein [Clostridioides difficile]MDV9291973.1 hypothetical protein [Clostridioides difficile]
MIGNKEKDFEKVKIHMGYCIFILVLLVVVLFTMIGHDNKELASQVAFGATLSGIILSILAIILTLIGETKSDNVKDTLLNISKELENVVDDVKEATESFERSKLDNDKIIKFVEDFDISSNYKYNDEDNNNIKTSKSYIEVYKEFENCLTKDIEKYVLLFYYSQIICLKKEITKEKFIKGVLLLERYGCDKNSADFSIVYGSYLTFMPRLRIQDEANELSEYIIKRFEAKYPEIKSYIDNNIQ